MVTLQYLGDCHDLEHIFTSCKICCFASFGAELLKMPELKEIAPS